ncbi:MAG TPA: UDP-N-acetylmuramoyl-L-alanine--D-glutamate ligase [Acidimicrobiales bacterium]|nr:UDP-N-acetylmuramoyl-L-alanine--D-glutamate ligase [Acidimicrobiales bacterium]
MRALVYGLAITGDATVRALEQRGWTVVVADDRATPSVRAAAEDLGVELIEAPSAEALDRLVDDVDLVSPSPGLPEQHRLFAAAARAGVPVRSEIELAYAWEQSRTGGPRPMVAVTGTDGKTTTTLMATAMVEGSGRRAVAAGNTELPLVAALDLDVDVFLVECSSFRLAFTEAFRAEAAVWLNLAPDHLDWHRSPASYEAAKARIWAAQRADDAAIGNGDDLAVLARLHEAPARHVTFAPAGADYHVDGRDLRGPQGVLAPIDSMRRTLPHDVTNALAAAAGVLEARVATVEGVSAGLAGFTGPRHRIELVASADGIDWYNDSKATTPHAAAMAIRGFERVVLLAGGRNKGLDLDPLAELAPHLRAVVALGEAAPEVAKAFSTATPAVLVEEAGSMAEAVEAARRLARPGDAVLLSPACASFDWYSGYPERGDDFTRLVHALLGAR